MIGGYARATGARRPRGAFDRPERAVIDIGSNTVRLVIYSGPPRAPFVWLNEKVTARLGRELSETGLMPDKSIEVALRSLARFAAIIEDVGVGDLQVVATAAVREAGNGPQFVEAVRALGLDVRVLSGEEEAALSATGVIGAFPGARGVVADIGGGSLELVAIAAGQPSHGISLPLGTLRLPALRASGEAAFEKAVEAEIERAGWAREHPGPLYMVGGTWRALARFEMHCRDHPLSDPQALYLPRKEAENLAREAAQVPLSAFGGISGIPGSRAAGLSDAAAMLRTMLRILEPEGLVFSSWGLREGLLYGQLDPLMRETDPLLAAVAHFIEPRGLVATQATQIAAWTSAAAGHHGTSNERLRLAATMLAMAAARIEPNMRVNHCVDWALHKRWLGLDFRGRAMLATALRAACGKPEPTGALELLASPDDLREAAAWGLAIRLCRRLGAGSRLSLLTSTLRREDDDLVLWIDPSRAQLLSAGVNNDLKVLSGWLGLGARVDVAEPGSA